MDDMAPTPAQDAVSGSMVGVGAVLIFDGKGGIKRHDIADGPPKAPLRGFVLVAGNSRAPDFRVWLKQELGDFNAELLGKLS